MANHPNRSKRNEHTPQAEWVDDLDQARHTPGPWRNAQAGRIDDGNGIGKAVAFADRRRNEYEANARLIAAAPELLAALTKLQLWPQQNCWCPLERAGAHRAGTKIHTAGCLAARAVIAKAVGR